MRLKRCATHGLYPDEEKRCPKCKAVTAKAYDKTKRDEQLNTFYHSKAWKQVRDRQLMKFPLCVECNRPAQLVDHIKEIRDGGSKYSFDNLQSMCKPCHNSKTAKERKDRE